MDEHCFIMEYSKTANAELFPFLEYWTASNIKMRVDFVTCYARYQVVKNSIPQFGKEKEKPECQAKFRTF